jgi:hypothetical protein
MRLLLDENLPKRLKQDLREYEVYTTADKGWTGISNGKLLGLLIENGFDALLTFDKNLQFQQNFLINKAMHSTLNIFYLLLEKFSRKTMMLMVIYQNRQQIFLLEKH